MRRGLISKIVLVCLLGACGDFNYYSATNGMRGAATDRVAVAISEGDWELAETQVEDILDSEPENREANILLIKVIFGKYNADLFDILVKAGVHKKANAGDLAMLEIMSQLPDLTLEDRERLIKAVVTLRKIYKKQDEGERASIAQMAAYSQVAYIASLLKKSAFDETGKFNKEFAEENITPEIADEVVSNLKQVKEAFDAGGEGVKAQAAQKVVDSVVNEEGAANKDKLVEFLTSKAAALP